MNISEKEYKNICKNIKSKKKKTIKKDTEPEIQSQIREFLEWKGWFVIRHQQSLGSLKGLSDLTAIKKGLTIYIEVKTEKGVQSEYQKKFQENIENHGGIYILARNVKIIEEKLKGFNIK